MAEGEEEEEAEALEEVEVAMTGEEEEVKWIVPDGLVCPTPDSPTCSI